MAVSHGHHFTAAKLLMGAHAAGLTTCVTVLKDYASTPQYHGVGVFAILFGAGLIFSILYYTNVFMVSAVVRNSIMNDEDPNDAPSYSFLVIWNVVSASMSVLTFVAAIVLVIAKSASL